MRESMEKFADYERKREIIIENGGQCELNSDEWRNKVIFLQAYIFVDNFF